MSDSPKSTPTFSFGTGGGPNLFGSTPANNSASGGVFGSGAAAAGSGLFGSSNTTPATSSSTLLGSTSATSAPQPSVFGSGASTGQSGSFFGGQSSGGGNLFGGNTGSTGGFSGFSTPSKPSETSATSAAPSSTLFGGAGTGGINLFGGPGVTPATSSQAGAATPAASKPGDGFSFATVSTTPAGLPPAGVPTSGTGFSFTQPKEQSSNMFGKIGTQTSSQTPFSKPAPPNPFGGASGGGLFGSSKPTDSTSTISATTSASQPTPNPFANIPATSGTGLFGGQKPASNSAPSPFSQPNKPNDGTGQTSQVESPKVAIPFGGLSTQNTLTTPSSVFSSTGKDSSSATPKPLFSFPSATTTTQSSSPASAAATTSSPLAGLGAQTVGSSTAMGTSAGKTPDLFASRGATTSATSSVAASSTAAPATTLFDRVSKPSEPSSSAQPATQATAATSTAAGDDASRSTNLGASTTGPKPPAQSRLKNKSMDEIITRWASDLAKYQKEFQKQALKVSEWDRLLVENSDKIQKLYGSTLEAERATGEVERQLSAVENDQAELEYWLEHYEKQVDEMMSSQVGQGDALQGPDQERERTLVGVPHASTNPELTSLQI